MKTPLLSLALLLPLPLAAAECRPVTWTELRAALPSAAERLVFFASWCSSCSKFITADRIPSSVFVAVGDEKLRAEKVLSTYLKDRAASATCFFDKDESIAKALSIRNLPSEKSLRDLPQL